MKATFWGVRGCIPAPGRAFNRYGGNTPCVSVESETGSLAILDAGTGITALGKALMAGRFGRGQGRASVILTHAHWDHVQGFPFFAPLYVAGNKITIYGASGSSAMFERTLEGQMNPHFSPIQSLRNFAADIELIELADSNTIDGFTVGIHPIPHGNIEALAIQLSENNRTLVYAPDAGYANDTPSPQICDLYRDADLFIHDCTYTPQDKASRMHRGNASIATAVEVAAECAVKHLIMFHYDQDYTDEDVDALQTQCRVLLDRQPGGEHIKLTAAYEGLELG